jgi:uncharacterized protein YqeY
MSIFAQIKHDLLTARKARDTTTATFLSTLSGEMESKATVIDGNKVVSDDVASSVIKKFGKGIDESLEHMPNDAQLMQERKILDQYIPKLLSETELTDIIQSAIDDGKANIGAIMGLLKAQYPNLYDGKTASDIANKLLKRD